MQEGDEPVAAVDLSDTAIARHLFDTHRGHRSLIFAGARREVEKYTVQLSEMGEAAGVPEEFFCPPRKPVARAP